ncbi:MAG: 7-cyano-7-deazaguanine synthase QueC [Gemmatimonadetes bacterium]|nr:7-cyano-7-deazaguanine synthase QueC [Gemmatimonadota bacterium]MYD26280.1 7-cyano-7-deazaguanine synthase QueC [Gemmatimonadota bacterium]
MKAAVVLLSGGVDSATTLAMARHNGFACHAITFDYGQRHRFELEAARRVAESMGVGRHVTIPFDLRAIGGSALTDEIPVPMDQDPETMAGQIPSTYVPARNTIFLSFALGWAEVLGAYDLHIGANAIDYSGYPDCRPEYIAAFERMANLATRAGVTGEGRFNIHAPLIEMSKADILRTGVRLGVDYALTTSCYDPADDGAACGRCDACILRRNGFEEAGIEDPTRYAS